jgi:hypothetical protein
MKLPLSILLVFFIHVSAAQTDTIKIHFLYGSRPVKNFKGTEPKWFGGIKGGHVNIEAKGKVLDFLPGKNPLLPDNKKPSGGFHLNNSLYWDTASCKWITVLIPVSPEQMDRLQQLFTSYSQETPYDYAVFGMRCAAASYDVLSEIGLVKKLSQKQDVIKNFYPKLLRKRMLKMAQKNSYTIIRHEGRASRKWEKDEGIF